MISKRFELDDAKAANILRKHCVAFQLAREIWNDPFCFTAKVCEMPEPRWLAVGHVDERRLLSAIFTYRGPTSNRIRIISAHSSTKLEEDTYYGRHYN